MQKSKMLKKYIIGSTFALFVLIGVTVYVAMGIPPLDTSDEDKPMSLETNDKATGLNQSNNPTPDSSSQKDNGAAEDSGTAADEKTEFVTPGTIIDLTNWKLELPIDTSRSGTPDEVKFPELKTFSLDPFFTLNAAKNGVRLRGYVGGVTTKGSSYPRSELREMTNGGVDKASWSSSSGYHSMTITQAITHLPAVKNHIVAGQIHDASDDVIMIRLEGSQLFVESGGKSIGGLDSNYTLGTIFTIRIVATESAVNVYYNNILKVTYKKAGSGYYFKAGCYTQSNPSKGDSPDDYGEVVIYNLAIEHH